MKFYKNLLLVFFVFVVKASFSQQPIMLNYTTEDGIPGSEVFDVIQDDRGYIWMATNNGICKFNGKTFKSYYTRDGLPGNSVIEFFKDSKGKIWLTTYNNKLAYIKNDSIYPYKYNQKLNDYFYIQGYCITSLYIKNENIFIGLFNKGIFEIDKNGNVDSINYFSEPASIIYKLKNNKIIHANFRAYRINYRTEIFEKDSSYFIYPFNNKFYTQIGRNKYALYGNFIASSYDNKLLIFDKKELISQRKFESDITKLRYDMNGCLLVCTYKNGLSIFIDEDISKEPIFHFLKDKTITSVYIDNISGYWITTLQNGVFYIPSLNFQFVDHNDGLKEDFINNIEGGENELWFSSRNNIIGYLNKKEIKQYDLSGINSYNISDIVYDYNNKTLWGGFDGGLNSLFHLDKNSFKSFKNIVIRNSTDQKVKDYNLNIKSLLYGDDKLLIGHVFGIDIYNPNKQSCAYNIVKNAAHTLDYGKSFDEIWFGDLNGLHLFKNNLTTHYEEKDKLFKKRIIKLKYDRTYDQLWVATKDSGIYMLRNDSIRFITKNDGLAENNITALYVKGNKIWVGTTEGMDQITITDQDKFTYDIQHFNENKGLVSNIINDIEVTGSNVFVATNKGISFFDYEKVTKNLNPAPVYITNFKINNRDTVLQKEYNLRHKFNNFIIEYDGLSYRAPKEVSYKYILEGIHTEWQSTVYNQIEFPLLPPGKYRFIIYAVNEDGIWSSEAQKIKFKINPPFYETWWFITLMIFMIVSLTATVFRFRIREIKNKTKLEKDLIGERQKALGHQINPHFIFNTLSSIQYYMYKKDKVATSVYLEKFAHLMRNTLYNSQNQLIPLHDEIESLKNYMELEQLALDEKFEFIVNIDENADIYTIKIPAFLIQPYLENAVWHGINKKEGKGTIIFDIQLKNDYILCSIEDNGIGREASAIINKNRPKSHVSLGGQITEKRLKLLNSLYHKKLSIEYTDLKDEKGYAAGTKVLMKIPVFYD